MILTLAETSAQQVQQQIDGSIDAATPVTLIVVTVAGLVLWLMGRKLTKPAIGLCGFVVGAAAVYIVTREMNHNGEQVRDGLLLLWLGGGAVAGLLLAWLLYRVWMAVSMGALAALVVSAAFIVWAGEQQPPQEAGADTRQVTAAETDADATPDTPPRDGGSDLPVRSLTTQDIQEAVESEPVQTAKRVFLDVLGEAYEHQAAHVRAWWRQLEEHGPRDLYISLAVAVVVGLLLGFVTPNFSASVQTSLVGGFLLLSGLRGLAAVYAEKYTTWLPDTPPTMLVSLGLITLLGVGVQWMIWRRQADK